MKRDIIEIDQDLCIGCGLCAETCHQGAIEIIDGKATLVSEEYCDGLGRCLPDCPTDALKIVQKEVVHKERESKENNKMKEPLACGCPGSMVQEISAPVAQGAPSLPQESSQAIFEKPISQLTNWPIQLGLVPTNASYFDGAHLLIAADCTAFAYGNFHQEFTKGKICLIGCPKLDTENYSEKLTELLKNNNIASITVLRMEVPCCAGIVNQVTTALAECGKVIPWGYKIISLDGRILD